MAFDPTSKGYKASSAKPLPVVLLLDVSGSMSGEKINALNAAVRQMLQEFPKFAQGEGGLVRHTKAAVSIAKELLVLEQYDFSENEKDQIYAALILHDTYKAGKDSSEYDSRKSYTTVTEHPVIAHDMIYDASDPDAATVADLIITHMGQWNTKYHSTEEIMPKPVEGPEDL